MTDGDAPTAATDGSTTLANASAAPTIDTSKLEKLQEHAAAFKFPQHWDAYLTSVTQPIFMRAALDPLGFDTAVRDATLYLETRIRALCDAPQDMVGVDLMKHAFKPDPPRGLLSTPTVGAEAQGLFQMFYGSILQIRNPVGHRAVGTLAHRAFDTIAFVNYLLHIATECATERFVYPFLPTRDRFRSVQAIKRVDIDGDGADEFVVLVGERDWTEQAGGEGRVLVLNKDCSASLPGDLRLMPGYLQGYVAIGDIDGDGHPEVVASLCDDNKLRHGLAITFDGTQIVELKVRGGGLLRTHTWPFEIVKPMSMAPDTAIIAYDDHNGVTHYRFDAGELVEEV